MDSVGVMTEFSPVNKISYMVLCLFIISFLVFLSSTQPFVLTEILGDSQYIVSVLWRPYKDKDG